MGLFSGAGRCAGPDADSHHSSSVTALVARMLSASLWFLAVPCERMETEPAVPSPAGQWTHRRVGSALPLLPGEEERNPKQLQLLVLPIWGFSATSHMAIVDA